MSFESDLYAELSGDAGVTTLVEDRIYPSKSESTTTPYIVYTTIFNEGQYNLAGDTDLSRVRVQVDCYAEGPDEAAEVARAVIEAIPETGRPLHRTSHSNQDLGQEDDTRLFRRMLEFSIFHRA